MALLEALRKGHQTAARDRTGSAGHGFETPILTSSKNRDIKENYQHSYSAKDLVWNERQWDITEGTQELKEWSVVCEAASAGSSPLSSGEV